MLEKLPITTTTLERRTKLPEKPAPVSLLGKYVRLESFVIERDAQHLFEISNISALQLSERFVDSYDADELIWGYLFDGPFNNFEKLFNSLQFEESL